MPKPFPVKNKNFGKKNKNPFSVEKLRDIVTTGLIHMHTNEEQIRLVRK